MRGLRRSPRSRRSDVRHPSLSAGTPVLTGVTGVAESRRAERDGNSHLGPTSVTIAQHGGDAASFFPHVDAVYIRPDITPEPCMPADVELELVQHLRRREVS